MQYVTRLLIIPACSGLVVYLLFFNVFCLQVPYRENTSSLLFTLGVPFLATFFSQLHRMDVLRRIERLEHEIDLLQIQATNESNC
jgi:hypothetical protein